MNFEGMKNEYEQWQKGEKDRAENKQRMNVSDHAYLVLQNDMTVFLPQDDQRDLDKIPSGFINQIFRNFRKIANSSVANKVHDKEIEYDNLLTSVKSSDKKKILSILTEKYASDLKQEAEKRLKEKGNSFSFRIDKNNIQYLASEDGQAEKKYYKDNITHYLKAVIEEYAELPYAERECIYYKEIVDEIDMSVKDKKVLKIFLRKGRNERKKSTIKYMKVLGRYSDKEHLYNYVAGLMSDDRKGTWSPGAIRLTSMAGCERLEQPAFISKENAELITALMRKQGVQYLSAGSSDYKVVVKFTPRGEKMYQRVLHLRPLYINKREDKVYEFHCSKLQAESYFFKFGPEVKILEPVSLAEEFRNRYMVAADQYLPK